MIAYDAAASGEAATLSPFLESVFPHGVVAAERRAVGHLGLLHRDELGDASGFRSSRAAEFAAGRACARRALAAFELSDVPLRMGRDRRPHWPAGMVGTITHTGGFCGAAVALRTRFASIGADAETIGRVTPDIWTLVFTPRELRWLRALRADEQSRAAAILFSAKEAFYKCQFGVTRQWLDFHDIELDVSVPKADSGGFFVRAALNAATLRGTFVGRFRIEGDIVATGIAFPA